MEIGEIIEVGERKVVAIPAPRETPAPPAPENSPEREKEDA